MGASGLNFFNVPGVADAALRRDISNPGEPEIRARAAEKPRIRRPPSAALPIKRDYKWGRVHRLVIDHPLGRRLQPYRRSARQSVPSTLSDSTWPARRRRAGDGRCGKPYFKGEFASGLRVQTRSAPAVCLFPWRVASHRVQPSGRGQRRSDQPAFQQPARTVAYQRDLPLAAGSARSHRVWRSRHPDPAATPCRIEHDRTAPSWRPCLGGAAAMSRPSAFGTPGRRYCLAL